MIVQEFVESGGAGLCRIALHEGKGICLSGSVVSGRFRGPPLLSKLAQVCRFFNLAAP